MPRLEPHDIAWFTSHLELRSWLVAHHETAPELWVGMRPKASGLPSVTWPELVDEVLCVGWIDSIRKSVTRGSCIRITPRRQGSIWSARNVARVETLRTGGRMQPAGEAAFAARREDLTAIYSFEHEVELDDASVAALRGRQGAWAFWEAQPRGYRRSAAHWVNSAKREETRAKRLEALVDGCGARVRLAELTGSTRTQEG